MTDERRPGDHFGPGCACTTAGEDPECPHHGYEAVIHRLESRLAELEAALLTPEEADAVLSTLTAAGWSLRSDAQAHLILNKLRARSSLSGGGRKGPDA